MTAPEPLTEAPANWGWPGAQKPEGLRLRFNRRLSDLPDWITKWLEGMYRFGVVSDSRALETVHDFLGSLFKSIAETAPELGQVVLLGNNHPSDQQYLEWLVKSKTESVRGEGSFTTPNGVLNAHVANISRLARTTNNAVLATFCVVLDPTEDEDSWWSSAAAAISPLTLLARLDSRHGGDKKYSLFLFIAPPNPSAAPLHALTLSDLIGAQPIALDPIAPRLNLITGDNGLGKSFLLDTAWWSLTGTWAGPQALPEASDGADPTIAAQIDLGWGPLSSVHRWNPAQQGWSPASSTEDTPLRPKALVVYAQTNNRFALWDPARSGQTRRDRSGVARTIPPLYRFSEREVLDGIQSEDPAGQSTSRLCLGLIDEWREWQQMGDARFQRFQGILAALGPDDGGAPVVPGALRRLYFDDARAIPTLRLPHGEEVPILFAPAGYRRMAMLAYLLTWAVNEHENACRFLQRPPAHHLVLLIDEPETHLHPRWQRSILRGLRAAIAAAGGDRPLQAQILLVTHAPLLLASAEPHFDPAQDALWKLDLAVEPSARPPWSITVTRDMWRRRGSADAWLTSDVFDLQEAQSQEAERAIAEARRLIREEVREPTALQAATAALEAALSPEDRLLHRWRWHLRRLDTPP